MSGSDILVALVQYGDGFERAFIAIGFHRYWGCLLFDACPHNSPEGKVKLQSIPNTESLA